MFVYSEHQTYILSILFANKESKYISRFITKLRPIFNDICATLSR